MSERLVDLRPIGSNMLHLLVERRRLFLAQATSPGEEPALPVERRSVEVVVYGHTEKVARENRDAVARFLQGALASPRGQWRHLREDEGEGGGQVPAPPVEPPRTPPPAEAETEVPLATGCQPYQDLLIEP